MIMDLIASEWWYAGYIAALVGYCRLAPGSTVLDVGCGRGFFSHLLWKNQMKVHGIDLSESRIACAREAYSNTGITFEVADFETAHFGASFDCVFVRSFSPYNTDKFRIDREPTRKLLKHLKPGGTFLFIYNSKFSGSSPSWRYHSLADVKDHFDNDPNGRCFFSSRVDARLLGKYAFNPLCTRANALLSRLGGVGGDIIYVFRKPELHSSAGPC